MQSQRKVKTPYEGLWPTTEDTAVIRFHLSGEFAMLHHAAAAGAVNLDLALMETLTSMRRAGGDVIITYFTPKILDMLKQQQ